MIISHMDQEFMESKKKQLDKIVKDSLEAAALYEEVKDRLHSSALGLSGGQQQRFVHCSCFSSRT